MESDHRYYSRRAVEERQRALKAITPAARQRHQELAALFKTKADLIESGRPLHLVSC